MDHIDDIMSIAEFAAQENPPIDLHIDLKDMLNLAKEQWGGVAWCGWAFSVSQPQAA